MFNIFFDTHCHLNFKVFDNDVEKIINDAFNVGVKNIVIPGTDIKTSEKAIKIAEKFSHIYAAVGIHPHHVFEVFSQENQNKENTLNNLMTLLKKLINHKKVVAIGEIGLDRYLYKKTRHKNYQINEDFIDLQKMFFVEQIKLAYQFHKSLIIHNREAKSDLLKILKKNKQYIRSKKTVFHCCEADEELLDFAIKNNIFIGVDGDIYYDEKKQFFIKKVLLELLVIETDAPFLSPYRKFPNQPKNLPLIAEKIASIKNFSIDEVAKKTTENGKILFNLL